MSTDSESTDSESEFGTTRQAADGYQFARAWIRFWALFIDSLIAIVPLSLLLGLVVVVRGGGFDYADYLLDPTRSGVVTGLLVYTLVSVTMIAWLAAWQSGAGASPGMFLLRLRVRGPDGQANASLPAAVVRNAVPILASINAATGNDTADLALSVVGLVVYIAIGVSISNSPTRQGLHDRLAGGTYVLHRVREAPKPSEHERTYW